MTRSNAAHEPSMDEILASIRRIIESGDEGAEPIPTGRLRGERATHVERIEFGDDTSANVVARFKPDQPPRRSAEEGEDDPTPLADASAPAANEDAEMGDHSAPIRHEELQPEDGGPAAPFVLGEEDDLAARLREEFAAEDMIDWSALTAALTEEAAEPAADVPNVTAPPVEAPRAEGRGETSRWPSTPVHPQLRPAAADAATSDPRIVSAATAPAVAAVEAADPARPDGEATAPFIAANSDSRRMQEFRAAVLDDLVGKPLPDAAAAAPLTSGRTGELVGASFDELAEAIREGQLRSLEEMAQDLLRPMLQDWLDDNLPKLVERLVREEIERVARGGRR